MTYPRSRHSADEISQSGARYPKNALGSGTTYDHSPFRPGIAFRTLTTSGPKPSPMLLTKYSSPTRPTSKRRARAAASCATARSGACRATPTSFAKSLPVPTGTTPIWAAARWRSIPFATSFTVPSPPTATMPLTPSSTAPFTVITLTWPVSAKPRMEARTLPFTEYAFTGPRAVSAWTSPLTVPATTGALAPTTRTAPLTVVAPIATPRGSRTVKLTRTSLCETCRWWYASPGPQRLSRSPLPHSAQIVMPSLPGAATIRTVPGSECPKRFTALTSSESPLVGSTVTDPDRSRIQTHCRGATGARYVQVSPVARGPTAESAASSRPLIRPPRPRGSMPVSCWRACRARPTRWLMTKPSTSAAEQSATKRMISRRQPSHNAFRSMEGLLPGAVRAPARRGFGRSLSEVRAHVSLIAVGTDAVTELRGRASLDIALERHPRAVLVPQPLAVAADREQPFEGQELVAQSQNALGDLEARDELVGEDRLRDEVVHAGRHRLEKVAAPRPHGLEHEIRVGRLRVRADPAAQLEAVHLGHQPIGDHHAMLGDLPDAPGFCPVLRRHDLVPLGREDRLEHLPRRGLVLDEQDLHRGASMRTSAGA